MAHPGGRPALYKTPEDLKAAVDDYVAKTTVAERTVTGLVIHLGFNSRHAFYRQKERGEEFLNIVSYAKLFVENSYEISLRGTAATGSIFALKNMGWRDSVQLSGDDENPVKVISEIRRFIVDPS